MRELRHGEGTWFKATPLRSDFQSVVVATSGFLGELFKGDRCRSGRFSFSGIPSADWMETLYPEGGAQR